ncbi:hypothetical protein [Variovorax sp. 38R]|uniref:hypothetical protein n=1 Tax=Variovorax sp. 38R TaxID=2774875 RepID=UPI0017875DDF|nr:hypothetical protein [Variovorax sp. 38R]QOF77569.1 hypothetical protein IG196_24985 [Variovorax sp. 38R]
MNNDSACRTPAPQGKLTEIWLDAHRYIARTLRVSAHHLPWEIVRQIHTGCQSFDDDGAPQPDHCGLRLIELDDFSWRADVTADNIAATQVLGWHALRRLLRLAQTYDCEALELTCGSSTLPAALGFEIFEWPGLPGDRMKD